MYIHTQYNQLFSTFFELNSPLSVQIMRSWKMYVNFTHRFLSTMAEMHATRLVLNQSIAYCYCCSIVLVVIVWQQCPTIVTTIVNKRDFTDCWIHAILSDCISTCSWLWVDIVGGKDANIFFICRLICINVLKLQNIIRWERTQE